MDGIIYITPKQAEIIHRKTITYSGGGTYEPLDVDKLDSVLQHMQNDLYYPTFVDKLTHLFAHVNFIVLPMVIKGWQLHYRCNFYLMDIWGLPKIS